MIDISTSAAPSAPAPAPFAPVRRPSASTTGLPRILLVDDEGTIRLALARFLRERGYDVHECGSGPAALAVLETASAKMRIFRVPEFLATAFLLAVIGMLVHILLSA